MPHSTFSIVNSTFLTGDAPSAFADPCFIAKAGETNRVTVLIGKSYHVTCQMPIVCVGKSSDEIDVNQNSPTEMYICWPVTIEAVSMRSGSSFSMNVWPDCLGGGFTWTNVCCSISVSGWTFTYSCDGTCTCSGCCAIGYYGYESYSLPAYGGSCGCSSHSNSDPGNNGEEQASVGVSFSEDALFYEEAYTNEPGVVVDRRVSTNVTLACSVYGGPNGGVFGFSKIGFDKLSLIDGAPPPEGPLQISAGETRTWSAVYTPLTHSSGVNDISASATFDEYFTGDSLSDDARLTVVKLTLEPQTTREGCENRHLVGVRENVNCYAVPDVGQWGETGGGELSVVLGTHNYTCPIVSDNSILYYDVGSSRHKFNMIVVEPFAMVARNPVAKDFGIALNHAGGAGMNLDVYVMPETVCFSGIAMEEVPSTTGIHQGYFANVYFTNVWYHTIAMRAGRWKNISPGNWWDTDRAWMGEDLPRELPNGEMTFDLSVGVWSSGMLVWDITWGWSEKDRASGDLPVGQVAVPYNQTFTFYPDGTLEVLKFQQVVSRGTNNVIRLNGEVVQGVPLTLEETNEINGND